MERVVLKGIKDLKENKKYMLNKIVNNYYNKISRMLKNDFTLKISVKEYATAGKGKKEDKKTKKFSIKAQVLGVARNLETHDADWDLNRTTHSVLKKMLKEIEHQFRVSEQGRE